MELENNKITFKDLAQLFWIFFKLGLFTIGGGMAMCFLRIAVLGCGYRIPRSAEGPARDQYVIGRNND